MSTSSTRTCRTRLAATIATCRRAGRSRRPTRGRCRRSAASTVQNLPITKSWYDALEMQVRQRVRGANNLQVSYTLSRVDDRRLLGRRVHAAVAAARSRCRARLDRAGRSSTATTRSTRATTWRSPPRSSCRHAFSSAGSLASISGEPVSANTGLDLDGDTIKSIGPPACPVTVGRGDTAEAARRSSMPTARRRTSRHSRSTGSRCSRRPRASTCG